MPTHFNENNINNSHFNVQNNQLHLSNPTERLVLHHRAIVDFETTSPHTIGVIPANSIVTKVTIKTTTSWNGNAPTIDIGISGSTYKYLYSGDYTLPSAGTSHTDHIHERETSETTILADLFVDGSTAGVSEIYVEYATS